MSAEDGGEAGCRVEVIALQGGGVERERGLDHGGVVGGEPGEDRLPGTIGVGEAPVAAHTVADEAEGGVRERDPGGLPKAGAGKSEGGDHQAVPVGEDLVVGCRPYASAAAGEE